MGMQGTVGRYPIAMIVKVRDHVDILAAHYSYASKKIPIQLTGRVQGEEVTLQEPGGGTFHLHFVTTDASAQKPLTFWTSTGLTGTWTKDGTSLPVEIGFREDGQDLVDCAFYPPERQSAAGPRFPNPGCEHTPNRAVLDECSAKPFTTNKAVAACVTDAMKPCRDDQHNINMCVANVSSYFDQLIRNRLRTPGAKVTMDAAAFSRWAKSREASCIKNSEFSPDGSGYSADIDFCMSWEMARLLQNNLVAMPQPFKLER
jgi:hypothetical protein